MEPTQYNIYNFEASTKIFGSILVILKCIRWKIAGRRESHLPALTGMEHDESPKGTVHKK
jgi:hypothetical protein